MNPWNPISSTPSDEALIIVFIPEQVRKYVFCTGIELPELIKEFPTATYWKVVTDAPIV